MIKTDSSTLPFRDTFWLKCEITSYWTSKINKNVEILEHVSILLKVGIIIYNELSNCLSSMHI